MDVEALNTVLRTQRLGACVWILVSNLRLISVSERRRIVKKMRKVKVFSPIYFF